MRGPLSTRGTEGSVLNRTRVCTKTCTVLNGPSGEMLKASPKMGNEAGCSCYQLCAVLDTTYCGEKSRRGKGKRNGKDELKLSFSVGIILY